MAERAPRPGRDLERVADQFSDQVTTGTYKLGALAARMTPSFVAAGLALPFGAGASFASPERRQLIERHLRRVDPSLRGLRLRRASRESFDYYARYWIESFRLPNISRRAVASNFEVEGFEHLQAAFDAGKGALLTIPHLGGWEWAGRWSADRGHGITVVVERIEPPELFDWFVELRSELGMNVVPLGPDAAGEVTRALADNHVVCLLCDRDIQRSGPEVEFFGERTTLPAGPATLALRTGAPLLPTAIYFADRFDKHLGYIRPPITVERGDGRLRDDVQRITQDIAGQLEILIRRAPTQWHMFQPNWPSDPGYDTGGPRT